MALLEQDHAFEIADAIIAESDADETEVSIEAVEDRFVRYAADGPTQSADRESYRLSVRVRFAEEGGYREARSSTGALDEGSAIGALQRAMTLARISGVDPEALALGGAVEVEGTSPSRPTQDHSFREKAAWIDAALQRAETLELAASGLARTTVQGRSLVNSAGRRVHGASSRAEFSVTCADRGAHAETTGGAAASSSIQCFVDQVDAGAVIEDAVSAAIRSREPKPVEAGPQNVVLEPAAVAALLSYAGQFGFGAQEVHEGRSFMAGRLGEALFSPSLSIVDDPTHPLRRGWRFDGEGAPVRRTELVRSGTLQGPVTDDRWARRLGIPNTGHGVPQPSSEGPVPVAMAIEPGSATLDDLVAEVGDGIYVRQLHYVNAVEPRDLVLTGMTRGGTFRIRDGRVSEPLRNLRFTQSLVASLASIIGIGNAPKRCGSLMGGEVIVPAIAIRNFKFTSTVSE